MRYHQVNKNGELLTGVCNSKPVLTSNGKLQLHECWQWTSDDKFKRSVYFRRSIKVKVCLIYKVIPFIFTL